MSRMRSRQIGKRRAGGVSHLVRPPWLSRHSLRLAGFLGLLTNIWAGLNSVLAFEVFGCVGKTQIRLNTGFFGRRLRPLAQCS